MPTREQLLISMESQMEFPETRREDDPLYVPPKPFAGEFTGEVIGTISIDPETKDIVITPTEIP